VSDKSDLDILNERVREAERALQVAIDERQEYLEAPERNVFETLEDASDELLETLLELASEDCEGSHCMGLDRYERLCYVGDVLHLAVLTVEYNRHDKRYYYVDGHDFTIAPSVQ
jgi:hypothetical protein